MLRVFVTVGACLLACAIAVASPKQPPDLLLVSWKRSDGEWVFRVIPDNRWVKSTHNQIVEFAAMTIEYEAGIPRPDFFDTLQLYANTPQRIIWADYVGTRLTYPPRAIVDEIKRYATAHNVHLSFERIKR
jgi:hypothetical protein